MELNNTHSIIIVTGGPGTGKSYAAGLIAKAFPTLELLSYDLIKEKNWDHFGFDNAAQKDRLNWFSLEEFYLTIQKNMWEEKSLLIEYPFYQRHREKLAELIEASGYRAVTLLLYGDWKTIYQRGQNRDQEDNRHPGHLTLRYHFGIPPQKEDFIPAKDKTYEEFRSEIDRKNYDIGLGKTIRVDVTDFSKVSFEDIFRRINDNLC